MDEQLIVDGALDEEPAAAPDLEPSSYRDSVDVETLVEQLCYELEGAVDQAVVDQVVRDMVSHYRNARIKAFVPIFIRRDVINLLGRN